MRSTDHGRAIWLALRASLSGLTILSMALLVPAGLVVGGTWLWPRGLAFLAAYGAINAVGNIVLAIWRPAHFRVRQQSVVASREKRQPLIDAAGTAMLVIFTVGWMVFIPVDVFLLHLLPAPPAWLTGLGGVAVVIGAALTPLAVWENRFATPNVQDQTGDSQHVVDTGVYHFVRHPIYLGNLLLFVGAALWLGSMAACLATGVHFIATLGRIMIEEKDLRTRLPSYGAYARRVRGSLIPFVI